MSNDRVAAGSIMILVGVLFALAAPAIAQPPVKIEDRLSDPVYVAWTSEPAVAQCVTCHLNNAGTAFSRQSEMRDWIDKDKHAIARQRVEPYSPSGQEVELVSLFNRLNEIALRQAAKDIENGYTINVDAIGMTEVPEEWVGTSNLLSRRICDKLWGQDAVDTEAGYERFRQSCLTCHGGVLQPQTASADSLADYPIGIDCLYCHQEGDQDAWQKKHVDDQVWRLSSPEQKKSHGMSDLVNTANQASMCLDCHVGNRDKQMFVSHAMYAAGHPPLPSIEVQTYCQQMPRHWQTPSQLHENLKGDESRDAYFAMNYPGVVGDSPEQTAKTHFDTRKMFIGALVARRKAVQLMVDASRGQDWGDYALYDCAACHHELRTESIRQQRYLTSARPSVPGRPRQHEWQTVLLDVAYRLGGKDNYADVARLELRLSDCFDAKPFGLATAVEQVGAELLENIDRTIAAVSKRPFDASLSKAALKLMCETDTSRLLTYDAARQVVWAVNVMAEELQREGNPLSDATVAAIASLNETTRTGVDVSLPAGRGQFIYPDALGTDFEHRAKYEPARLKAMLEGVRQTL